ncbi:hypothetical protein CVD28_03860 [Bacillus sp. M6-12]|uniref:hypothetical protein n=1 Tax=Bacillus sp. M6-12 TaxID=2054166 RepID=UPI000C76A4C5|nr:hypothetical protein [Bacillus sp. M6-12]PLS19563.1 hypothetical protein CVD28_03860 [Bacillus sp. M6-12]
MYKLPKVKETEVHIEDKHSDMKVVVNTKDAKEVIVNGKVVWSLYDELPDFLQTYVKGCSDFIKYENEQLTVDVWMKETTTACTFYIPDRKQSKITARLDFITSLNDVEYEYIRNNNNIDEETADKLVAEFKESYEKLNQLIESYGFKLVKSHDSGDFLQAWWDIHFYRKEWNEEVMTTIWKAIADFNKKLDNVYDKYGR